jgi:hypothetical protein
MFADTEKDDPIAIDEANFWKDDFFSNSLEYYLNIIDSEVFGAGEDMEDEEDEDEDDDDEGDKKRRKSKGDKKPAGGADKEKCKNQ